MALRSAPAIRTRQPEVSPPRFAVKAKLATLAPTAALTAPLVVDPEIPGRLCRLVVQPSTSCANQRPAP